MIERWFHWLVSRRKLGAAFVILTLVTLLALFYAEENWRGERAWLQYRGQLEAKAESLNLADFLPRPVPDEQNFGAAPFLKQAIASPSSVDPPEASAKAALELFDIVLDNSLDALELQPDGHYNFKPLQDFFRRLERFPTPATAGNPASDVMMALTAAAPVLTELRQGMRRPFAHFAIDRSPVADDATLLLGDKYPPLNSHYVFALSRTVGIDALAALDANRNDVAFEDSLVQLRISELFASEPALFGHVLRLATLAIVLNQVRHGLSLHAWSDPQLAELTGSLLKVALDKEYLRAVRSDRAYVLGIIEGLAARTLSTDLGLGVSARRGFPRGWLRQNQVTIARHQQGLIEAMSSVGRSSERFREVTRLQAEFPKMVRWKPWNWLAAMYESGTTGVAPHAFEIAAHVAMARAAIALEQYRLVHHEYPLTLAVPEPPVANELKELSAGFGLHYFRKPDGSFLLYSSGLDGRDDGGDAAKDLIWR